MYFNANGKLRHLITILLAAMASIYLTYIVDYYTFCAIPQKVLIFLFFFAVSILLTRLKKKSLSETKWGLVATSVVLAATILIMFRNTFLPLALEQRITLRANRSEDAPIGEVWLVGVEIDGEYYEASVLNAELEGWIYSEDYDDYVYYPGEENAENSLTFTMTAAEEKLRFGSNPWSGSVEVLKETDTEFVTLYSDSPQGEPLSYTIEQAQEYSLAKRTLLNVGALTVIACLLSSLLPLLLQIISNSKLLSFDKLRIWRFPLLYLAIWFFLFDTSEKIASRNTTRAVLLIITMLSAFACDKAAKDTRMTKYTSRSGKIILILIAIYCSFASFGYRFFLVGDQRPVYSPEGLLYFALGFLWYLPLVYLSLYLLESKTKYAKENYDEKIPRVFARACLFFAVFLPQMMVAYAFWPGGFPNDCTYQMASALGEYPLDDFHPILHTLSYRLILYLFHSAGAIVVVQIVASSLLFSGILQIGYEHGVRLWKLCLGGAVFALLPNQVFNSTLATKDYPYMLALLWGMLLIYRLLHSDGKAKPMLYVCLSLDLFLIYGFRHNGVAPWMAMLLMLAVLCLKRNRWDRVPLAATVIASVLAVALYTGPVFSYLDVIPNSNSNYITMLCAIGSCFNKDLPLSERSTQIMLKVMPESDWKEYYSRFYGVDMYYWGGGSGMNTAELSAKDAFSVYFEALYKYPDVIIKDRIDGMNLLWDVTMPADGWNVKCFDFIYSADGSPLFPDYINYNRLMCDADGIYRNHSPLAEAYRKSLYTERDSLLDVFLWRSGAYLIVLWIVLLYVWKNEKKGLLCTSIPLLGNILGLCLVMFHQSFRYVYAVQVMVVAMLLLALWTESDEKAERREV